MKTMSKKDEMTMKAQYDFIRKMGFKYMDENSKYKLMVDFESKHKGLNRRDCNLWDISFAYGFGNESQSNFAILNTSGNRPNHNYQWLVDYDGNKLDMEGHLLCEVKPDVVKKGNEYIATGLFTAYKDNSVTGTQVLYFDILGNFNTDRENLLPLSNNYYKYLSDGELGEIPLECFVNDNFWKAVVRHEDLRLNKLLQAATSMKEVKEIEADRDRTGDYIKDQIYKAQMPEEKQLAEAKEKGISLQL